MKTRVLVVDDEKSIRTVLMDALTDEGYAVRVAADGEQGLQLAGEFLPQVVLLDIRMPGVDGITVLETLLARDPFVKVIMLTAHGNLRIAIDTMARGAYHYLVKPFDLDELALLVDRAAREWQLRQQVNELRSKLTGANSLDEMLGNSGVMERVFKTISQVAPTEASVLITGERGTGKELVARSIHKRSGREGAFVPVNCAALPGNLLESELFGHVKGAFTGAVEERQGLLAKANGGTLFLDEVAELPADLQAKLLRALQEKHFYPLGGSQEVQSDFRVLSVTNADLEQDVKTKAFRSDLYYRLRVICIYLPPLRQRGEDVCLLAARFLEDYNSAYGGRKTFSPTALSWLRSHSWPGNIRQLKSVIHQAVILTSNDEIHPSDLEYSFPEPEDQQLTLEEYLVRAERDYLQQVLALVDGDRSQAAELLAISRKTLYNRLQKLGIQ